MTDEGKEKAGLGRKEGRGERRQRKREEKGVAHGGAQVHRALPTRPGTHLLIIHLFIDLTRIEPTYVPDTVNRDTAASGSCPRRADIYQETDVTNK